MPQSKSASRHGSVLIIEDDAGAARGLQALLQTRGHRADVVADADSALAKLEHGDYGLVVTDLDLGDSGGTELVARLRRSRPDLAMLVVSARDRATVLTSLPRSARVECLEKPVDPDRLLAAVEAHFAAGSIPARSSHSS